MTALLFIVNRFSQVNDDNFKVAQILFHTAYFVSKIANVAMM